MKKENINLHEIFETESKEIEFNYIEAEKIFTSKPISVEEKLTNFTLNESVNTDCLATPKAEIRKKEIGLARKKIISKKMKALDKIDKKTSGLIEKSRQKERSREGVLIKTSSEQMNKIIEKEEGKIRASREPRRASYHEYLTLKGVPKIVMNEIKEKAHYSNELKKWIAIIDTDNLTIKSKKPARHISIQIYRMQKQGWFQIIHSSTNGTRLLEIKLEYFTNKI